MSALWWQMRHGTGWGDIISPLCIASNTKQQLHLFWDEQDERAWARQAVRLVAPMHEHHVTVRHHFGLKLHRRHSAFDDSSPQHNVGFHRSAFAGKRSGIVVTTPLRNRAPLPRDKQWKTPDVDWADLADAHPQVDYRTPALAAVETLLGSALHIGYHGSCAWLARWCGCPQIVLSSNLEVTRKSFAQAVALSELPAAADLADLAAEAGERLNAVRNARDAA